ncbi:hypothetical protein BCR41DRAFT_301633 [Lobosporangium transversale]|uniref:STEEP1 domain-containing protein n=1 Tax=Lobosporangium transversale TaxID=64571 RepID=A0A1Y2GWL4_9FUNG|nr:hypothetical protein BCR41DRAFT_301633 [Lobosporangium transversale]ORZ24945.1 hypothetical protein BCR41DRAFT_301633 [Lobosporangium transversale]|eukprot:XP_021883926.1 hypothetical protein BCR41DRAFT_301633 [Lobosporangium transversale]
MPRIISNSIISSSDHREEAQGLHSYYCLCSEFILVIDMELSQLPRRETDNAVIIENATRMYRLHTIQGENKIVKRRQVHQDKFEKQYRLYCPRCNLLIAYETTPHLKGGPYTYIVQGALNEIQGVPHQDWELDLPNKQIDIDQDDNNNAPEDMVMDDQSEMEARREGNQDAASKARAFLIASATSAS